MYEGMLHSKKLLAHSLHLHLMVMDKMRHVLGDTGIQCYPLVTVCV